MHYPLTLVKPAFDDPLTDLIIDLDHLRRKTLGGTTHPSVFFQLKHLFHMLESIGSARIEGNNTTVAEYVEETLADTSLSHMPSVIEIRNLEEAMTFIDEYVRDRPFDWKWQWTNGSALHLRYVGTKRVQCRSWAHSQSDRSIL